MEEVKPDIVMTEIAEQFVKDLPDDRIDLRAFAAALRRLDRWVPSLPTFDPDGGA